MSPSQRNAENGNANVMAINVPRKNSATNKLSQPDGASGKVAVGNAMQKAPINSRSGTLRARESGSSQGLISKKGNMREDASRAHANVSLRTDSRRRP